MGRSISWNCISGGGGATLCRSGIQVNQTIIRRTFGVNSNPYTSRPRIAAVVSIRWSFYFVSERFISAICSTGKTELNFLIICIATFGQINIEIGLVARPCASTSIPVKRLEGTTGRTTSICFESVATLQVAFTTRPVKRIFPHWINVVIHISEPGIINGAPVSIRPTKLCCIAGCCGYRSRHQHTWCQ